MGNGHFYEIICKKNERGLYYSISGMTTTLRVE